MRPPPILRLLTYPGVISSLHHAELLHSCMKVLRSMPSCRGMSLEEFKFIFWMEYAHRMWGRMLGLVFAVPATYFVYRGWVNGALGKRLGLLFAMGVTQGLVGWWMVRSGLQVGFLGMFLSQAAATSLPCVASRIDLCLLTYLRSVEGPALGEHGNDW